MKESYESAAEFLLFCKLGKNLSDKTIAAYRLDLQSYLRFREERPDAGVMQYVSRLVETRHKSTTVKRHLASLKQYYKYICRDDRLSNPMLECEFKLKAEKTLPRTIAVSEVKRLLAVFDGERVRRDTAFCTFQLTRDAALLDLLCATGIRIGEAAALRLEDVDLRSRILLIRGKGRKERLVFLSCKQTAERLRNWIALRAELACTHSFLFVNRARAPISIRAIEDIFAKYRDLAKINARSTPHYLRHTFATNLLENGADLRSVQEILGHSSVSVTERYTEVTAVRKIKVLKKYNYRNTL